MKFVIFILAAAVGALVRNPMRVDYSAAIRHMHAAKAVPLVASPFAHKHATVVVNAVSVAVPEAVSLWRH